jgi:hypothetical protein
MNLKWSIHLIIFYCIFHSFYLCFIVIDTRFSSLKIQLKMIGNLVKVMVNLLQCKQKLDTMKNEYLANYWAV